MCMGKGYVTRPRNLILEYITSQKDRQFSATDVYNFLLSRKCQVNLVTVYRNLDKMLQEGILLHYKYTDQNCSMYQYAEKAENCENHLHLKCKKCGKVIHLECSFMEEISRHLMEHHGFQIDCKESAITGICEACRDRQEGDIQ